VGRIGVDAKGFVAVTDFDQKIEIVGAHRPRAGVDFVAEIDPEGVGALAEFGCFFTKRSWPSWSRS